MTLPEDLEKSTIGIFFLMMIKKTQYFSSVHEQKYRDDFCARFPLWFSKILSGFSVLFSLIHLEGRNYGTPQTMLRTENQTNNVFKQTR